MLIIFISYLWFYAITAAQQQAQDSINIHMERGIALFDEHDDSGESLREAEQEFLTVLSFDSTHAPAIAYLELIALNKLDTASAELIFNKALSFGSTCPEARIGLARLFRLRQQYNAGTEELRTAVTLSPASLFARWELVSVLMYGAESTINEDRMNEAYPYLQFIVQSDSNQRQAHLLLAQIYEHFKLWNNAVKHYRKVLRIGQIPEDMDVWVYEVHQDMARCLENLGQHEEAIGLRRMYWLRV